MTRKNSGKDGTIVPSSKHADNAGKGKKNERTVTHTQNEPDAGPRLDPAAEARIGNKLKAMYDQVVNEPVPDHLLALLGQLDEKSHDDG